MEEEIAEITANERGWGHVYAQIRRDSMNHDFTTLEASRPENRLRNRYRDVYPYDHSRVKLESAADTDYINASLVKFPRANRQYILTQGPLPATVEHFWLMVWQQNTKAVLMLNRIIEKGQLKCHQYWPFNQGEVLELEGSGLKLEHINSVPGEHYTVRTLRLTRAATLEHRDILHFHYTTWPDFGVPQCPDTFLEFLHAVRDSGSLDDDVGPPVVHCSAGIGRSGTFCLVDTCLVLLLKEGPGAVVVRKVLLEMRNFRMGLIQTPDQLKFSYLAIGAGARSAGLISPDVMADLSYSSPPPASAGIGVLPYGIVEYPPPKLPRPSLGGDSDSDSDCAPPPMPPPRSESLKSAAAASPSDSEPFLRLSAPDVAAQCGDAAAAAAAHLPPVYNTLSDASIGGRGGFDAMPDRLAVAENGDGDAAATQTRNAATPAAAAVNGNGPACVVGGVSGSSDSPPSVDGDGAATLAGGGGFGGGRAAAAPSEAAADAIAPNKTDSSTSKCILKNDKMEERKREMEVRRRKKVLERSEMDSKIKEMKRKAREAEDWEKKKRGLLEKVLPFCVGLAMLVAGAWYYWRSSGS